MGSSPYGASTIAGGDGSRQPSGIELLPDCDAEPHHLTWPGVDVEMHAPQPLTVVELYRATAQLFHWLTALLVVVADIASVGGPETRVYSPANDFSRGLHELLALVPVTAILSAWLEGHPLTVLAVGNVQPWLPPSRQLGLALANIHGWLGNVLIWLAGLHAGGALYHHFWRRDTVLLSMLPGRRTPAALT